MAVGSVMVPGVFFLPRIKFDRNSVDNTNK